MFGVSITTFWLRWKVRIIIILGILAFLGLAYWYYTSSQNTIQELTERNAILKIAQQENVETIDRLVDEAKRIHLQLLELEQQRREAEEQRKKLEVILREHDLKSLSSKKPGLIERRVNNATRKLLEDIESITSDNGN